MTEFGLLLAELMQCRGIVCPAELAALLISAGYYFDQGAVLAHMQGVEGEPDYDLVRGASKVLGLNQEEKTRLTVAFLFGQRPVPAVPPAEGAAASP